MQPHEAAHTYALALKTLKAEWYYTEPRFQAGAAPLAAAADAGRRLAELMPASIDSLAERRSFWINIYNGAVIAQAIATGARQSVREVRGFFRRPFIDIAGQTLSLDDIEHGLLRRNRRHPARLLPPLWRRPGLKSWQAAPFDPRLHFALNCGAQSCPPLAFYSPEAIDSQLALAATAFLQSEVEVDGAAGRLHANPILRWYSADFGGRQGLLALLTRHRDDIDAQRSYTFSWKPYDWSI